MVDISFKNTNMDYWLINSKIFLADILFEYVISALLTLMIFNNCIMSYGGRKMHFRLSDNCGNSSEHFIFCELLRKAHSCTMLFHCLTAPWLIITTLNFLQCSHSCFHAFFPIFVTSELICQAAAISLILIEHLSKTSCCRNSHRGWICQHGFLHFRSVVALGLIFWQKWTYMCLAIWISSLAVLCQLN